MVISEGLDVSRRSLRWQLWRRYFARAQAHAGDLKSTALNLFRPRIGKEDMYRQELSS